jgi:flagellin-like hook-associated protein FlgL
VSLANTSLEGRYVFAGDSDQAAPYTIDLTQSSPISPYGGSPSTRQALHPSGYTFSIARTADEIFDNSDPTKNVLSALNNLRVALQSDSDQGVKDALTNIETASTHLNQELAFYGSAQNQIDGAIEFSDRKAIQLRQQLAGVEEADTVQAILDLQNARLSYEAALGARARLPNVHFALRGEIAARFV